MHALSQHDNDAVLHEGYLTDLPPYALFLAKEVPEDDLPLFRAHMVHRLQEELLLIVVPHIGLEIAHGYLLTHSDKPEPKGSFDGITG